MEPLGNVEHFRMFTELAALKHGDTKTAKQINQGHYSSEQMRELINRYEGNKQNN